MHFRSIDGGFDAESFKRAVDLTILAQEILVGNARYPTEAIGRNSEDFRPLGLGYANLGALLMASGVPYDSDGGRACAAAITALMTGEAYAMSARIAERVGPVRRLRAEPRAVPRGHPQARAARRPDRPDPGRRRACSAPPATPGPTRCTRASRTATATPR